MNRFHFWPTVSLYRAEGGFNIFKTTVSGLIHNYFIDTQAVIIAD